MKKQIKANKKLKAMRLPPAKLVSGNNEIGNAITDFVGKNPKRSVDILRKWMKKPKLKY